MSRIYNTLKTSMRQRGHILLGFEDFCEEQLSRIRTTLAESDYRIRSSLDSGPFLGPTEHGYVVTVQR